MKNNAYFYYDASFRLSGLGHLHSEITTITGIVPNTCFIKGQLINKTKISKFDLWSLKSPLEKNIKLDNHLNWIWSQIQPHKKYFKTFIKKADWADILLGCRTEHSYPVLFVDRKSLDILKELNLSVGFNFTLIRI